MSSASGSDSGGVHSTAAGSSTGDGSQHWSATTVEPAKKRRVDSGTSTAAGISTDGGSQHSIATTSLLFDDAGFVQDKHGKKGNQGDDSEDDQAWEEGDLFCGFEFQIPIAPAGLEWVPCMSQGRYKLQKVENLVDAESCRALGSTESCDWPIGQRRELRRLGSAEEMLREIDMTNLVIKVLPP